MGGARANDEGAAGEPATDAAARLLAAEAGRRRSEVQYEHTAGVIDLTWGHPDPSELASEAIAAASADVLGRLGWQSLAYGAPAGAGSVREAIAAHLTRVDSPTDADQIVITAGSSGALDLVLSLTAKPGDVVFVERPTYFLALRIFADHGVTVVGLGGDADGPSTDALCDAVRRAQSRGARTLLYLVPTFANPTGRCLFSGRAAELLEVAASTNTLVIEDDVYRDTNAGAPTSMWSIDPSVVRLGSFSKSVAPGLRVGYLTSTCEFAARVASCGVLDSGGGVNHFASMVVGELTRRGDFDTIVRAGQARYASRRGALASALDRDVLRFDEPSGGFFLWLRLPPGVTSRDAVAAGIEHGVLVSDGALFFVDPQPDECYVRASFSMLDERTLVEGGRRLGRAIGSLR